MSEKKKTTTLYLRRDLVERCRQLGINISDTTNRILEVLIESPGIRTEEIRLEILKAEKQKLTERIEQHQKTVAELQRHVGSFDKKIEQQQSIVKEIQRSDEIAHWIRVLNQRIKEKGYDEKLIRETSADVLTKLRELGIPIHKEGWLKTQIERVSRLAS